MSSSTINFDVLDGVGTITLNRPDVLNSFDREMGEAMQEALRQARDDASIRCILITGAGRAFCAGQDLADVVPAAGEPHPDLSEIVRTRYNPIVLLIRDYPGPVVAAVNGVAAGAGANLALACDLVFASEKASFIQSFSHVGLVPDTGGTYYLPRLVGTARATAMMFLAEKHSADDMARLGAVYKICAPELLMDEASDMAAKLARRPTRGLALTKRLLNASAGNTLEAQLAMEADLQGVAGRTEDYAEGVSAFLEKRKPEFKGQ